MGYGRSSLRDLPVRNFISGATPVEPTCSLRLAPLAERYPETNEVNPIGRRHHETVGGTRELRLVVPSPAPEDLEFARGWPHRIGHVDSGVVAEPILRPFPDVTMDVIEPQLVGALLADRMGVGLAVLLGPGELVSLSGRIPEAEEVGRACPTGVFPLRYRRKPVFLTGG